MGNFYGKALIIDNNVFFVDGIKEEVKLLNNYPCLFAKTFQDALQILKNPKHNIRVIFLSNSIGPSHGLNELKEIRTDRPLVPVILISHNPDRLPPELTATDCGFTKILQSPNKFSVLTHEIDLLFKSKESWTGVAPSQEEKDVEINLVDNGYIPTLLADFVLTPKSFFNIYIKIGQSKFIKIINAGDSLKEELVQAYTKKGITHFYVSIEEHKKYIRFCEEISKKILSRQDIIPIKKINHVINLGANIAQSLIHTGISEEKLDYANTFLNQSVNLIKGMRMKNDSLKKFLATIEIKEHSATVSFLAGMIANEIGMESLKSIKLVGISALLHDIGLYDLNPDFKEEDIDNFSPEQIAIFDRHSKHGGELLRACGGFDEVVYQAVESHHMRRRGFDTARRTNNINMVTEIIGAADELHHLIINDKIDDQKIQYYTLTNLKNFSPQIEKAILKLLQKKKAA
jgi:putative nucleotidyltransferase with HDIG domain